jgi:hypothetical protein
MKGRWKDMPFFDRIDQYKQICARRFRCDKDDRNPMAQPGEGEN